MTKHRWGECSPEPGIPLCQRCKRRHTTATNYVKAAWRLKRVQSDPDMGILLELLTKPDERHASAARAQAIAEASGRITIETSEQLRTGIIAVAYGTRIGGKHSNANPYGPHQYLASGPATWRLPAGVYPNELEELDVTIEPMVIEFPGRVERVVLYNEVGVRFLGLGLPLTTYPRAGMTFEAIDKDAGDFVRWSSRTSYEYPGIYIANIVRREDVINARLARGVLTMGMWCHEIVQGLALDGPIPRTIDGFEHIRRRLASRLAPVVVPGSLAIHPTADGFDLRGMYPDGTPLNLDHTVQEARAHRRTFSSVAEHVNFAAGEQATLDAYRRAIGSNAEGPLTEVEYAGMHEFGGPPRR